MPPRGRGRPRGPTSPAGAGARNRSGGRSAAAVAVAAIKDDAEAEGSDASGDGLWDSHEDAVNAAGGERGGASGGASASASASAAPANPHVVPAVPVVQVQLPVAATGAASAPLVAAAAPGGPLPNVAGGAAALSPVRLLARILPPANVQPQPPAAAAVVAPANPRPERKDRAVRRAAVPVAAVALPPAVVRSDVQRIAELELQLAMAAAQSRDHRSGVGHGRRRRSRNGAHDTDSSGDERDSSPASRLEAASFADGIRECLRDAGQVSCRRFVETESFKDGRARNECVALAEVIDIATNARDSAGVLVPWTSPIVEAVARRLVGVMTADRTGNWTIATVVSRSAGSVCPLVPRGLAVVMAKAANAIDRVERSAVKSKRTGGGASLTTSTAAATGAKKPRRKGRGGRAAANGGGPPAAAAGAAVPG